MFKTFITFGLCSILLFSCAKQEEKKQSEKKEIQKKEIPTNVEVAEIIQITEKKDGYFNSPRFSEDGSTIFFTNQNYSEIWSYSLSKKSLAKIAEGKRIGQNYILAENHIIAIEKNKRGKRGEDLLVRFDISSGTKEVLHSSKKGLSNLFLDKNIVFRDGKENKIFDSADKKIEFANSSDDVTYQVNGSELYLMRGNNTKILKPFEDKNILWIERFASNTNLIVSAAGDQSYIIDEDGNVVKEIGVMNNAKISSDDNFVVYYMDKDNGMEITSSDLYVKNLETGKVFTIAKTDDIQEINPSWSSDNKYIVFGTANGEIKLATLKFN